jgi:hypothetical protein
MRIGVCTFADENVTTYSEISTFIHRLYCSYHGYTYKVFSKRSCTNKSPHWEKIVCLQNMLNESFDYVMWIDADAIFYDFSTKIEDIIQLSDTHIYWSSDFPYANGPKHFINTGVILCKCTSWVKQFLEHWLHCEEGQPYYQSAYHEQQTICELYYKNALNIKEHSKIYGSYLFNMNLTEDVSKKIDYDFPLFLKLFYNQIHILSIQRSEMIILPKPPSKPYILHIMRNTNPFRREYMLRRLKEILQKYF